MLCGQEPGTDRAVGLERPDEDVSLKAGGAGPGAALWSSREVQHAHPLCLSCRTCAPRHQEHLSVIQGQWLYLEPPFWPVLSATFVLFEEVSRSG